jgi:T-complex protein 1 subunit delta
VQSSGARIVKVTGVKGPVQTVSIIVRGANEQILDETERSLHDAQCAIRCLVKKKQVLP